MVKMLMRSAVVAGILLVILCAAAMAQSGNDIWASWWDRGPNVTYYWDDWASLIGDNPYAVQPDLIVPPTGGSASAVVTVDDTGADLIAGPIAGFGSKTKFWDLGPGGGMHIDTTSDLHDGEFMDIWVQVTYYQGWAGLPTVSVNGATQVELEPGVLEWRQLVEGTGDVGTAQNPEPTGWITYMSLWRLEPGATEFSGIDIATGPDGAMIDSVIVDTRILPEPTAALLGVLGNCLLIGWRIRRRK